MTRARNSHVALLLESPEEAKLWAGAFTSQGVGAQPLAMGGGVEALAADPRMANARGVMIDAPALAVHDVTPAALAAFLQPRFPGIALFVRLPARTGISPAEQAWARHHAITSLLPGSSVAAWQDSLAPVLSRMLANIGHPGLDTTKLERHLTALVKNGEEPRPGPIKDAYVDAYYLERSGVSAPRLYDAMQDADGVAAGDRTWRGRSYRDCFVAQQAVDWLVARFGLRRATALQACRFLWRTGRLHHALREAGFDDDFLFFRFSGRRSELDPVDLVQVEAAMRAADGVAIEERMHLAKTYPRCFVGSDAVDWLMARYRLPLGAAETIGQRLLELGVFHHVVDEHGFVEGRFFYRFRADEETVPA